MPIEKEAGNTRKEYRKAQKRVETLWAECHAIRFAARQKESWQDQVATDLSVLLARAEFFLSTSADQSDISAAEATLRIVRRVEEFEGIRRQTK